MQIVRTIVWVLLLVGLLAFSFFNWKPVEVTIWTNLILETKIPALVIVSFLLGLIPTWLFLRGTKWRLTRRIKALENNVRSAAVSDHTASTIPPSAEPAFTEPDDARPYASDTVIASDPYPPVRSDGP